MSDKEEEKYIICYIRIRLNSLICSFKDEDYIYLTKDDFEELKSLIPVNNLLAIINYTASHNHTKLSSICFVCYLIHLDPLPSLDEEQGIKIEESSSDVVENNGDEESTLPIQSSNEDLTLKESPDLKPKLEREESTISQADEDDKDKEDGNEKEESNDMYKKKKFKKIKLTNDLKNKLDLVLKQYKDDKWQTIKNMLNYIKEINTANPRYIELNIDAVHTVILNGLQNSRTAISRQALSVLSEVFLVQLDNLSPWLPQFFDILLSRLTSPQQFIVDEALNVIFQIQPLLPGKYYITQIKNAIAASNNPVHKSYYIKCLSSLFETIGKKIEEYSPAYFELLTRVNDNVPEQIKVFNTINNTLCQVYGEDNVDSFLKGLLKPPIYNAFKLLISRKDKSLQTPRSSTPTPNSNNKDNNNNNENENENQQIPVVPSLSSSEPVKIQKPENDSEQQQLQQTSSIQIDPTTPRTIIRRPVENNSNSTEEKEEENKSENDNKVKEEEEEERGNEESSNNDNSNNEKEEEGEGEKDVKNADETSNENGENENENGNKNEENQVQNNENNSEEPIKSNEKLTDISSSFTFDTANSKYKFSSKDDVENRLMRLCLNSKAFLESMDEKIKKFPNAAAAVGLSADS